MLKVILVDDEPLVIEGLLAMVDWQGHGYKVSGVAYNGEEGLELIKTLQPDLVITDIKMPGLDGLAMMDQAKKLGFCESGFMILSGYSEFDYVKSAMELASFNYILKPIDPDEIHQELIKHSAKLSKQRALEERVQRNITAVGRMTLDRLLNQPANHKLIGRLKFLMGFDDDTHFQVAYLKFDPKVKSKLCSKLDAFPEQILYTIQDEGSLWCLFCDAPGRPLETISYTLIEWFEDNLVMNLHMSGVEQNLFGLQAIRDKLVIKSKVQFYQDTSEAYGKKASKADVDNEEMGLSQNIGLFDPVKIMSYIQGESIEVLEYQLQELWIKIRRANMDPDLLKIRVNTLVDMLHKIYENEKDQRKEGQDQTNKKAIPMTQEAIKNAGTFLQLKKITHEICHHYWHENQKTQENKVTTDIIQYMKTHYPKDLKLKVTAKEFGYNSVYLGQLFQQETGMKYNDYLLKIRLEKSKELLLYSDLNVKEIAKEVGFKSGDYFVKKFKEMVGESPKRYRPS